MLTVLLMTSCKSFTTSLIEIKIGEIIGISVLIIISGWFFYECFKAINRRIERVKMYTLLQMFVAKSDESNNEKIFTFTESGVNTEGKRFYKNDTFKVKYTSVLCPHEVLIFCIQTYELMIMNKEYLNKVSNYKE